MTILLGEAASLGAVFKVWEGNGNGVAGSPSTDSEREGRGREPTLGDHGPHRIATNIQDRFSKRRYPKELSC